MTKNRYRSLLVANSNHPPDSRIPCVDSFHVSEPDLKGASILLIDDTFTTGSRGQSAAAALKQAGAGKVGLVCIGRHFNRTPSKKSSGQPGAQGEESKYDRTAEITTGKRDPSDGTGPVLSV